MGDIARSMKEREQAFEAQYKLSEEQNFKIRARRDKLFGAWAAKIIGLNGMKAETYAVETAKMNLDEPGDNNMIEKILKDLKGAGKKISDEAVLEALSDCLIKAHNSLNAEYPDALDKDHHA